MKSFSAVSIIVVVLSTITWVIFYYAFPNDYLNVRETALVVFIYTILTLAVQGFFKRLKSSREEKKNESDK